MSRTDAFKIKNKSKFTESLRNGWTIRYSEKNQEYLLCGDGCQEIIYTSKFGFEPGYISPSLKHVQNYDYSKWVRGNFDKNNMPYKTDDNMATSYLSIIKKEFGKKFNKKQDFIFLEEKNNDKKFGTNLNSNHYYNSNKKDFNGLVFNKNGKLLYNERIFTEVFGFKLSMAPWKLDINKQCYVIDNILFDDELKPVVMDLDFIKKGYKDSLHVKLSKDDNRDILFLRHILELKESRIEWYITHKYSKITPDYFSKTYETDMQTLIKIKNNSESENKIKLYLERIKNYRG